VRPFDCGPILEKEKGKEGEGVSVAAMWRREGAKRVTEIVPAWDRAGKGKLLRADLPLPSQLKESSNKKERKTGGPFLFHVTWARHKGENEPGTFDAQRGKLSQKKKGGRKGER